MRIFRAARFLLTLGLRVDAVRLLRATVLVVASYVAAPLAALSLRDFTNDVLARHPGSALAAAVLAATALVVQLTFGHFAHVDHFEVSEAGQMRLRGELMDLVNGPPRIDHLDSPGVADSVDLVRDGLHATSLALEGMLQLAGLLLQLVITIVLLALVNPWFVFLPLCAVVPVLAERRAQALVEGTRERNAARLRLSKHFLELSTVTDSVTELRLFGAEEEILRRQRDAWNQVTTAMWRAQLKAALYRAAGQGFFALGYGGAVAGELFGVLRGHGSGGSVGSLVLVITLAVQVSVQVSSALGILSLLQVASRTSDRITGLRALAASAAQSLPALPAAVPERLSRGITLENVSFAYPGATRPVLSDVSLHIPAGAVLALVGENGAGKSTLVKLLCGLYAPTSGRILVDGQDLAGADPGEWRSRVAALFQDFQRIELTLRESIGHGSVADVDDTEAVGAAAARARADRVLEAVPGGLDGYVGHSYADGAELSGGQWQTVGLARALMRRRPLLLILDEPAAALDASAEHDLFERYASSAGQAGREDGGVTVLISHRFSTVGMASLIAVLDHGQLTESGTHRELMAEGGLYAELFTLQARAYH
ncbi:MAG: ABC transporter ATP-binding protein/permease [Streptosporangiales bacterium]|nr:ABC transporter ATP-binding protein/permease [Streptosporangiales bacterium]